MEPSLRERERREEKRRGEEEEGGEEQPELRELRMRRERRRRGGLLAGGPRGERFGGRRGEEALLSGEVGSVSVSNIKKGLRV